ncbi:MAG: hypothetical protein PHC70_03680 [Patescibacteria group bacterium]|nr:hypothetical protein [Patescibacteria group bacterium]
MGERTLDALAGIVFIVIILGLEYLKIDVGLAKPIFWVFAILFHAYVFGKNVLPNRHWLKSWLLGLLVFLAVQSVIQTIWFYAGGALGRVSDTWSLVIAMAMAHLSSLKIEQENETALPVEEEKWTSRRRLMAIALAGAGLLAFGFVLQSAWDARTVETIRTPWPLLAAGTIAAMALLWALCAASAVYVRSGLLTALHAGMAIAATLGLAPIIYRIGYGFDGFLHLAGEQVLLKTGFLNPKPFYYIGQYVFTTWLARVGGLPLAEVDRWLVPVLASILLPASAVLAFRKQSWIGQAATALVLFPLGMFVATTPQGLAAVLGISSVMLALGARQKVLSFYAPFWLCAWSATIHPLAGIPCALIVASLFVLGDKQSWRKHLAWPLAIISGFAIPAIFFFASQYQGALAIDWNLANITQLSGWIEQLSKIIPWLGNKYVLWPAWSSLIGIALPAIGLLGIIASLIISKNNERWAMLVLLISAVSLWISSGLLENAGDFTFLIQYEKGDYAARLWQIATLLLLIGSIPAVGYLLERIKRSIPLASAVAIILFASIGAANAYNALPRHDAVQASRGWSTGADDVEAVRWIDRYAKGRPYTVLADQSVSAAAVKEYGFKRYAGDVFFYPIPTGGPLYASYLKMTYQDPSWDTVRDAAKLGQSDLVFVVINDYWWKASELNQKITDIAQDSWSISNGKVNVYVFDLKKPEPKPIATN